jgi:hypothetical protein
VLVAAPAFFTDQKGWAQMHTDHLARVLGTDQASWGTSPAFGRFGAAATWLAGPTRSHQSNRSVCICAHPL